MHASTSCTSRRRPNSGPLAEARARGVDVTGETGPQYLFLSADDYARLEAASSASTRRCGRPRTRGRSGRRSGQDGSIDMVATDHAPHARPTRRPAHDIWTVDCGFPGVETQMPLMLTAIGEGRGTVCDYVSWSAENPARAWGLFPRKGALMVGSDADIAIVDLAHRWTIDDAAIQSRAKISPWHGRRATALPIHTLVRGRFVMRNRVLQADARGTGRSVHPIQIMPPAAPQHVATTMSAITRGGIQA